MLSLFKSMLNVLMAVSYIVFNIFPNIHDPSMNTVFPYFDINLPQQNTKSLKHKKNMSS